MPLEQFVGPVLALLATLQTKCNTQKLSVWIDYMLIRHMLVAGLLICTEPLVGEAPHAC